MNPANVEILYNLIITIVQEGTLETDCTDRQQYPD